MLEGIAAQLRVLQLDPASTAPPPPTAAPASTAPPAAAATPIKKGDRVQITYRDGYYGRRGTLRSRHGRLFWNIHLDATDTDKARIIYKRDTSLALIKP